MSQVKGFRRVFAHSAAVFHERGIANTETNELSSLACEEHDGEDILMSVFEVPATKDTFKVCLCCCSAASSNACDMHAESGSTCCKG